MSTARCLTIRSRAAVTAIIPTRPGFHMISLSDKSMTSSSSSTLLLLRLMASHRINYFRFSSMASYSNGNHNMHQQQVPIGASPTGSSPTSTPFLLADIGEGISEVELLQWFIGPGDTVTQFDRVCQVQSDKASVEITSRFDGVVDRLCGEVGDVMKVGMPLLFIQTSNAPALGNSAEDHYSTNASVDGDGDINNHDDDKVRRSSLTATTLNNMDDYKDRLHIPQIGSDFSSYYNKDSNNLSLHDDENNSVRNVFREDIKILSSPAVRKLGKEYGIDLATLRGSGPGGRVLKADMLKLINSNREKNGNESRSSNSSSQGLLIKPSLTMSASTTSHIDTSTPRNESHTEAKLSNQETTILPIKGYHRLMVKSMTSSLEVPHMVYADEINMNALSIIRDSLRPQAALLGIPKLTFLPFFIKAASLSLRQYPILNSTINVENMTLAMHARHDIGVAVDTERGLTVPVVRGCGERSVLEIGLELGRLLALASEANLSEADISNPTFTLSNIGAIGGTYMSPIVLPPQVAIGAIGKIQRLPRFVDDQSNTVEAVRIMPISWGGDHRAIDGATMARFSNLWKYYCENPSAMMLAMR